MTNLNTLTSDIIEWAKARNINTPDKQTIKLVEEFGEFGKAYLRKDQEGMKDAIGDMYVVIAILANQLGFDMQDCVQSAYDTIAKRTGKTVNGTFIKDND